MARPFGFAADARGRGGDEDEQLGRGGETLLLPVLFLWRLAAGFVAVQAAFGLRPLPTAGMLLAGVVVGVLAVGAILRLLVSLAGWE